MQYLSWWYETEYSLLNWTFDSKFNAIHSEHVTEFDKHVKTMLIQDDYVIKFHNSGHK